MPVPPPEFIADYPTGRVVVMGENLRRTARNASHYIPPVNASKSLPVGAIIMPVSRQIKDVKKFILGNMKIAAKYDIYLVVLCSHEAKREDVAKLARRFGYLKWLAVDGPFDTTQEISPKTASTLDCPPSWDLSYKRNFGLHLARAMGWPSVLFADDDVWIQEDHFFKQIDLMQSGAKVVASNARHEIDLSVVTGAYSEAYGSMATDGYMSSQAILVDMREGVLGFYPQIYCEDWFFLIPYLLTDGHAAWAGSIPQRTYDRFTKKRAAHEEAGDLLAEGMLRLVMQIASDDPNVSFHEQLKKLVTLADRSYWEQQILHRAMVIQGILEQTEYPIMSRKSVRMKKALHVSLATLVGNEQHDGIQPEVIVEWIKRWADDVLKWQEQFHPDTKAAKIGLEGALVLLGVDNRAEFNETHAEHQVPATYVYSSEGMRRALSGLPHIKRTDKQIAGLESTWILSRYLEYHHLSMDDVPVWAQQLRYDRPIRSLSYNKPVCTVVMVVRAHEPVEVVMKAVQRIVRANKKSAPIHLVIWVDRSHDGDSKAYREFLLARVMLNTVGTNIRVLSAIGSTSDEQESEIIRVMALSYWKTGIDSVDHRVVILNSHNELLLGGTLADLINNGGVRTGSLQKLMKGLDPVPTWKGVHQLEDLRAAELLRQRLLRQASLGRLSRSGHLRVKAVTRRLHASMTHAGLNWLEVDDMQYTTIVHNDEGVDLVLKAKSVVIVPVAYGSEFRHVRSNVERALQRAIRVSTSIGTTVEIILAITGEERQDDLESYRQSICDNILMHMEWPVGAFMSSVIVFGASEAKDTLNKIEALVLYNHWLENQSFLPRLLWVISGQNNQSMGRHTLFSQRVKMSLSNLVGLKKSIISS